jgi:predicted ATPase/DNA-binding CsgD family transcriptional regulator
MPGGVGALPVLSTRFFGRSEEAAELLGLLDDERLLTLVGAPGCGKTRLAIEVGSRVSEGVRFVDLAPITDPMSISYAVAAALGVREQPGRSMEDTLVDELGETAPVLVLLDNCEHLVEGAAGLAQRLVTSCASVSVLATSRASLGVASERAWDVPPLDQRSAVELFTDRAQAIPGAVPFDSAENPVIEGICGVLDCLPLAVELTAVWTRALSPGQILERLSRVLPEPPGAARARRPQHETMAAAVEWSYRLLPEDAQALFRNLSVFAGTFDLDAVDAVASIGQDVLGPLTVLLDNSLVIARRTPGGPMRYRLLEPVRQFAAALLAGRDDAETVRRRHCDYYRARVYRYDPYADSERGEPIELAELTPDDSNLMAAYAWARSQPADYGLRFGEASAPYWAYTGRLSDGRRWLDEGLGKGTNDDGLLMRILNFTGFLAWRAGDYDKARTDLEEAHRLGCSVEDPKWHVHSLPLLAMVELAAGRPTAAVEHCQQALAYHEATGDAHGRAQLLTMVAWAHFGAGDLAAGIESMRTALEVNRAVNSPTIRAYAHYGLQLGACLVGDAVAQRTHLAAALEAMNDGGVVERSDWLRSASALAALERRYHSALRLVGGTETASRLSGSQPPAGTASSIMARLEPIKDEVAPALAGRLVEQGRNMSWEQLVAEALADPGAEQSRLTRREYEIAKLVAEGLSNSAIAERLVISRRTVESHLDHAKQKLRLRTRNEIMLWSLRESPSSNDS